MSEYIGSRISLISKSDIKYVGILKAIDSETATVSLANVQCHGTEGRKGNPAEEIQGSSVIYDGIVFRGSDVKDINILSAPKEQAQEMPNDPAILGSAQPVASQPQPPSQHQQPPQQHHQHPPHHNQQHFHGPPPPQAFQHNNQFGYQGPPPPNQFGPRFNGPGGPHGFPGSPGAVPGYGPPYGGPPPGYHPGYGPPPGQGFHPPPSGPFSPQQLPTGPHDQRQSSQQGPVGNKQGTPQPSAQHAPPPAQQKPVEMSSTPAPAAAAAAVAAASAPPPVPSAESKPSAASSAPTPASAQPRPPVTAKPAAKAAGNRVAVPLPRQWPAQAPPPQPPVPEASKPQNTSTATEAATAAVAAAMAKLGAANAQKTGTENLTEKINQMRVYDSQPRGRGRGRGAPRGDRAGPRNGPPAKTVEVPKEDYDFQSANAKFNKQELVKEAIASGEPITSPVNGDAADASAATTTTNGSAATGADADDVVIPAKPAVAEKGYDKKSSFFDNISSDLRDRAELAASDHPPHIDGRAMRSQERSKNMETFGQGSVDGGGYRGRGRGRGRGGFGRGGGRGGFHSGPRGAGFEPSRGGVRGGGRVRDGAETAAAV